MGGNWKKYKNDDARAFCQVPKNLCICNNIFFRHHDKYLDRYRKTRVKRIVGEKRDNIYGLKKDGTEFPMILKVSELIAGQETVFIGKKVYFFYTCCQVPLKMWALIMNCSKFVICWATCCHMKLVSAFKMGKRKLQMKWMAPWCLLICAITTRTCMFLQCYNICYSSAQQLIHGYNRIFAELDALCLKYKVEKIKTLGDTYMAVCTSGIDHDVFDFAVRVLVQN